MYMFWLVLEVYFSDSLLVILTLTNMSIQRLKEIGEQPTLWMCGSHGCLIGILCYGGDNAFDDVE
jgi:hypothetical protein